MWSYDVSGLNTTTATGRLYSVRLLLGDTDTTDQQLQDEEIYFALSLTSDNIYSAALWACNSLSSKYARLVDTQLDGVLEARYSTLSKQYSTLATSLEQVANKYSGGSLGVSAGGISVTTVDAKNTDPDRVKPAFTIDQFDNGPQYDPEDLW